MNIKVIAITLLIAVSINMLLLLTYHRLYPPRTFVTVDLKQVMHDTALNLAKKEGLELEQDILAAANGIEHYLHNLSKRNNLVILAPQTVVTGALDYTRLVSNAFNNNP